MKTLKQVTRNYGSFALVINNYEVNLSRPQFKNI